MAQKKKKKHGHTRIYFYEQSEGNRFYFIILGQWTQLCQEYILKVFEIRACSKYLVTAVRF